MVKFRRTGESTRSEDECGGRDEVLQVEGGRTNMESVSLADGAPVPREFANPTEGMIGCTFVIMLAPSCERFKLFD